MVQNPPKNTPQCCPFLFYDDVGAAARFLCSAFGFEERLSVPGPGGDAVHAEVQLGDAVIMLGSTQAPGAQRPVRNPKAAGSLNASVYVFVDDVDEHFERARNSGAEILQAPDDMFWGDRIYCAEDPEGQFWVFAKHVRDVAPEDLKPA